MEHIKIVASFITSGPSVNFVDRQIQRMNRVAHFGVGPRAIVPFCWS